MADLFSFVSTEFPDFIERLTVEVQRRRHLPTRGRVLVVPALPGSQLQRRIDGREEIIWFDLESIRQGLLLDVTGSNPLEVQGLVEPVYLQMVLRLRLAGYEVVPFPYDWRRSLRSVGADLAAYIRDGGRPVDLVTHSYGGLVARAAVQLGAPGVGQVIMLAAPNRGSFDVMAGIRGNHWVLHVLAALDGNNSALDIGRQCFGIPGSSVYECLPDVMSPGDLDALDPAAWPRTGLTPHLDLLAAARDTRAWLAPPAPGGPRFHGIAGHGVATLQRADVADDLLHYLQVRTTATASSPSTAPRSPAARRTTPGARTSASRTTAT